MLPANPVHRPGTGLTPRSLGSQWFGISLWLIVGVFVTALVATFLVVQPAHAGFLCGDRTEITKSLGMKYHEKLVASGLADAGSMIEIFASKKGTWTMIVTSPNGRSCYLASGENWEAVPRLALGTKT